MSMVNDRSDAVRGQRPRAGRGGPAAAAVVGLVAAAFAGGLPAARGQLQVVEERETTGTVESVRGELITIAAADGGRLEVRVPSAGEGNRPQAVVLADGRSLAFSCSVKVLGRLPLSEVAAGTLLQFSGKINRSGRTDGPLESAEILPGGLAAGVTPAGMPDAKGYDTATVVATVKQFVRNRLIVTLPPDAGFRGKTTLSFEAGKDATASFESSDVRKAGPGARVVKLAYVRLNTGDVVAKTLEVVVGGGQAAAPNVNNKLAALFGRLDNTPKKQPREIRSQHFHFMSDISDRQEAILIAKLERMVALLEPFFGGRQRGVVTGFIVHDLKAPGWQGLLAEAAGVAKIQEGAGICFNSTLGRQRRAVLYSCDDHGVVQHECVHGFCHMTFGSTGPTWLAEGVAEMGQYWKEGEQAVAIDPRVMGYLQNAEPKKTLLEIAVPGRTAAGTWQDYAWRWALCHLLANNPNYADRFVPLAVGLMRQQPGIDFKTVYGPVGSEISFEYDQFLANVGNGYRADLAAWDWRKKGVELRPGRSRKATVEAARGWQPAGVVLAKGGRYRVAAEGTWKTSPAAAAVSADGGAAGRGRLMAAVLESSEDGQGVRVYRLSSPIELGEEAELIAPAAGDLVLRCRDDWTSLADNDGSLALTISPSP